MIKFFLEGTRNLSEIGTLVPSSPWFAAAMTRSARQAPHPKRVLEIGPGTGAITRRLLASLKDGDELHLVEINPAFCRHLDRELLGTFRARRPRVQIELCCDSILSASVPGPFDFVICSLPFRSFNVQTVRKMFERMVALTAESGELAYMEYAGVRLMKAPFVGARRRGELRHIDRICRELTDGFAESREFVALNIMPSVVTRLTRNTPVTSGHRRPERSTDRRRQRVATPEGS